MRSRLRKDSRIPLARRLRRYMTDAERKLWLHLRQWPEGRAHFRRQATIGQYFVDFACHSNRIVIELDGGQHAEKNHAIRDAARDVFLKRNGYQVLRFWNQDVLKNVEGVLSVIAAAVERTSPPTLTPPHRFAGGEERKER